VVSRAVKFNEGISATKGAATASISEESRIVYDSITVLSMPQNDEQLLIPPAPEHQNSDSDSDLELSISSEENKEPTSVNPSLLL